MDRGRAASFFASLVTFFRTQQVTALITLEIDPIIGRDLSFAGKNLSALADNIFFLEHVDVDDQQLFSLIVLKMRYSSHNRQPHTYTIDSTGIKLSETPLDGDYTFSRRQS